MYKIESDKTSINTTDISVSNDEWNTSGVTKVMTILH